MTMGRFGVEVSCKDHKVLCLGLEGLSYTSKTVGYLLKVIIIVELLKINFLSVPICKTYMERKKTLYRNY